MNHCGPPPREGTSLHRRNNSVERPWGILSLFTTCLPFTLPEAVLQTSGIFVKAGSFSYGESPRTPPLEETSLHRRNNSVERPWGILSLFTICLPYTLPEAVLQTSGIFVKQVVFLTVNHRGPLPVRELHSTDEIIVWRDPGGSWACSRSVYHTPCQRLCYRQVVSL